jgi:hypothetical protein
MSRRRTSRRIPAVITGFLFVLVVVLACGSLAAWTPIPDGLAGALAVGLVLVGAVGGPSSGRHRSRRRAPRIRSRRRW